MKADVLTLDEATHAYRLGAVILPSVTQVIGTVLQDWSAYPQEVLARKRELGTLVHEATSLDSAGELDEDSVDEEVRPYLEAWRRFMREAQPRIVTTECIVHHPIYRYAGTLDNEIILNGKRGILDKKTGELDAFVGLQLAAYQEAVDYNRKYGESKRALARWAIRLRPDATYRLESYVGKNDFTVFLAALTIYNWRLKHA